MKADTTFTSESVCAGHPDKVADALADALLDHHLQADPLARVAVEVLVKGDTVVLAGEVNADGGGPFEAVVRSTLRTLGYTDPGMAFHAERVRVIDLLARQQRDLTPAGDDAGPAVAGDQGMVFGFACDETPELMPLPVMLAHALTRGLDEARGGGKAPWLRPDGKAQVTVRYAQGRPVEVTHVVVSAQHAIGHGVGAQRTWVREVLLPRALGPWYRDGISCLINPAGAFTLGGPEGDAGLTGRKLMVDTYGGYARHGGGAFSGKDASKVDRSAAYFARHVARQVVRRGLARACEIQVAYAIGRAQPLAVAVDTRGTGDDALVDRYVRQFDFRPDAMIEALGLRRPLYHTTTQYGHFGKPGLPWER